jgi:hypothetical protein
MHSSLPRLGARGGGPKSFFMGCCGVGGDADKSKANDGEKGLKMMVISMFVFAIGVTGALIIQIISGMSF